MKFNYLLTALVLSVCAYAQNRTGTYTISLYYAINETRPLDNFARLDSFCDKLTKNPYKISVVGYADFLSSDAYNTLLSQKRADAAKAYLLNRTGTLSNVSVQSAKGFGETNSKPGDPELGEPSQRRVDVCISEEVPVKKISTRTDVIQKDTVRPAPKKQIFSSSEKKINELQKGESLTVEGLSFIPGRHVLLESSEPVLEELLETLKDHPNLKIEIQGHICCITGTIDGLDYDTRDLKLSENRAHAIYSYLVKNGIEKKRLSYKGYGRRHPKIEVERTPEDEQANRRVDIKVLEN